MSPILSPAAVEAIWADTDLYADIGASLGNIALAGTPVIAPIPILKQSDADQQVVGIGWRASSTDAYRGEGLALCDADSLTGVLCVLLTDVRRGMLLPSQLTAPERDLQSQAPTTGVVTVAALWAPRDVAYRIGSLVRIDGNGNHTVTGSDGDLAWCLLSTAGSVDGSARPVGLTSLAQSAADGDRTIPSASGALGWAMVGEPVGFD